LEFEGEVERFKILAEHCWDLSSCLGGYPNASYLSVAEWLRIGAGLIKIEFDSARFDTSLFMCGRAADYEDARTAVLAPFVLETARFTFIWGALESLLDILQLPHVRGSQSDIDAACCYLKEEYEPLPLPASYMGVIYDLQCLLLNHERYEVRKDEFDLRNMIGRSGLGLHVVRKIRNKLAHGAASFPEPKEWGGNEDLDRRILATCSRVVLLSIQMLIAAKEKSSPENVDLSTDDAEAGMDILTYLRILHLQPRDADENQEMLNFTP
jgi:hypothetical protein